MLARICVITILLYSYTLEAKLVDFDKGMLAPSYFSHLNHAYNKQCKTVLYAKELYARNNKKPRIPKIIHIIWFGGSIPEKFKPFQESFKQLHPTWKIMLWNEESVKKLKLVNKELYEAAKNPGEKSDIVRANVLFKYGGLYIDTDVKCLKPFDDLHDDYDFYAGMEPVTGIPTLINNGVIGSKPGHKILKEYLRLMKGKRTEPNIIYRTGPGVLSEAFWNIFKRKRQHLNRTIILPASYFSPLGHVGLGVNEELEKQGIRPESLAIHLYSASWM